MKRVLLAVVVLLCTVSLARAADPVEGCYQKNSGALRVLIPPDTCRSSEVSIQIGGATGDGFVVRVYDAAGQYLGVSSADYVYIPSLKKYTAIDTSYVLGDIAHSYHYFESEDCSGQPYDYYGVRNWIVRVRGRYYTVGDAAPADLVFRSYWNGLEEVCSPMDTDEDGNPVPMASQFAMAPAVEVTLPFATPVALPLVLENSSTALEVKKVFRKRKKK